MWYETFYAERDVIGRKLRYDLALEGLRLSYNQRRTWDKWSQKAANAVQKEHDGEGLLVDWMTERLDRRGINDGVHDRSHNSSNCIETKTKKYER